MNDTVRTVLLVPMSSTSRGYPFRVPVQFGGVSGELLTDHLRSVDKSRLVRRLGTLDARTADALLSTLNVIFSR